ncbi:MAG: L-lactate dehydrogenase (FMN-dependent) related alpha-hydroxy acid dehydrogenase [uncultured archaeon A07HR67]|jgi:L-lactate dehydrogenase (FMN-dependent) and related alpha-hydroxy acid dehydrogenases|nr:MAG: L-lactate dehydrogenase (FMN-dependent) related alpha-hydroxy acid dehydrogenase [uncultured archaeon A07HR67]
MLDANRFGAERVNEIYREGMLEDTTPDVPVSYEDLRKAAHDAMSEEGRAYVHGGAGSEETFERNKDFSEWRIVPRMLRGVEKRDLSTEFLGQTHSYPLMLTPLGVQSLLHDEAELGTATGAADLDVPLVLSSLSSSTLEDVSEKMGDTPKMFQFYWSSDRAIAKSFLERAERAGYDAIVVTVDAPILGWRERLIKRGYYPFLEGEGVANYFSDPEFRSQLDEPPEADPKAAVEHFLDIFGDSSLTWEDLQFVYDTTDLPVVIKGILSPRDARLAIQHGADAIGVSTHGGRQVDGSITAFEALPAIAEAVDGEVPITFDSGVRHASDAYKALALGADSVLLGRPYAYGLAVNGADGVRAVLKNFIAEFDLTMGLAGNRSVEEIGRDALKHENELYETGQQRPR